MKKLILALLLLTACGKDCIEPVRPEAQSPKSCAMDIYILAGQSNAVGQGQNSLLGPEYLNPDASIYTPATMSFQPLSLSTNQGEQCHMVNAHGIEMAMMHSLAQSSSAPVGLVKVAVSGTPLFRTWPAAKAPYNRPDWHWACGMSVQPSWHPDANQLYSYVVAIAMWSMKSAPPGSQFKGFVWYQGESDSNYPERAEAWQANMELLLSRLREDLGVPDLKAVIIQTSPPIPGIPDADVVRQAQYNLAEQPNNFLVPVTCQPLGDIHLSSQCYSQVGLDVAQVFQ